jgi:hypothetical protein
MKMKWWAVIDGTSYETETFEETIHMERSWHKLKYIEIDDTDFSSVLEMLCSEDEKDHVLAVGVLLNYTDGFYDFHKHRTMTVQSEVLFRKISTHILVKALKKINLS